MKFKKRFMMGLCTVLASSMLFACVENEPDDPTADVVPEVENEHDTETETETENED